MRKPKYSSFIYFTLRPSLPHFLRWFLLETYTFAAIAAFVYGNNVGCKSRKNELFAAIWPLVSRNVVLCW